MHTTNVKQFQLKNYLSTQWMDFSENFTCLYQDEVASAHWKTKSLTLFTVMIWFREHTKTMVLISDSNVHDKTTVVPYSLYVFNFIKENFERVRDVEVWTGYIGKHYPIILTSI